MTIADYLQSEQAMQDAETLLRQHRDNLAQATHGANGPTHYQPLIRWRSDECGPWVRVSIGEDYPPPCSKAIRAYVRVSDDHGVVTDLGEAARAVRMRTGELWLPVLPVGFLPLGVRMLTEQIIAHDVGRLDVPVARLPRAICHMLLAAYGVGKMGT